VKEMMKDTF